MVLSLLLLQCTLSRSSSVSRIVELVLGRGATCDKVAIRDYSLYVTQPDQAFLDRQ